MYRVLTQFEAAGLVLKHNFEGGQAVYELDRGGHHDHMVDVDSGKIIEFESHEIEELQRKIAADHGYELEEHSLVLYAQEAQVSRSGQLDATEPRACPGFSLLTVDPRHAWMAP